MVAVLTRTRLLLGGAHSAGLAAYCYQGGSSWYGIADFSVKREIRLMSLHHVPVRDHVSDLFTALPSRCRVIP